MANLKQYTWFFVFCLGAGVVTFLALWTTRPAPSKQTSTPITSTQTPREKSRDVSPSAEPVRATTRSQQKIAKPTVPRGIRSNEVIFSEATLPPSDFAITEPSGAVTPTEEEPIYTMSTLPSETGMYWVQDDDGNINQISVDVPGLDSPIGY